MTLVDGETAAAFVRALGYECSPATIWKWVNRGLITRSAKDGKRHLYDLEEVQRVAERKCQG